jgi:signal transduction histidine kinase
MRANSSLLIVEKAYQLFNIHSSLETIHTATSRASKVVFALKQFAHKDSSGKKIEADINQGLNTVLILYRGLLKHGCEVIKHFEDLPSIFCHPDEMNQVWTNLIHNALQAMDNRGVLTLNSSLEQDEQGQSCIMVRIMDDGPGIPKELEQRIWETFFTTKASGEGSGLGLGICRRIVEKHQGELSFKSEPGKTEFTVKLPVDALSVG